MRSLKFRFVCLLGVALPLACTGEAQPGAPNLLIEEAWARPMRLIGEEAGGRANSAVYLLIRNVGDGHDRLNGAETPVSTSVELHESRLEDGVMRMRRVEDLEIPPGGLIDLRPGGYHLMLLGLNQALEVGDTLRLFLDFEHSGRVSVLVPIRLPGGN